MKFSPEMREQIVKSAVGKTVESLEWIEEEAYWVMTFTDGSETSFRFMAELTN